MQKLLTISVIAGISCILLIFIILRGLRSGKAPDTAVAVIKTNSGIEMVLIPAGWFEMGSKWGKADELPVHKVWIDSFLMDRYEVTQEQYVKLVSANPSRFRGANRPVDTISWADAALYCNFRSRAEGLQPCYDEDTAKCNFQANGYRLPTEAEWEYACRAGTSTSYVFGNNARKLKAYAWFKENSLKKTHPVGQKRPNRWKLYDMYGNVAEWCNDVYDKDYYKTSPSKNPRGPEKGDMQVLRGGAWNSSADSCQSSWRTGEQFGFVDACIAQDSIGFRCVKNAPDNVSTKQDISTENQTQSTSKTGLLYDDIYLEHKTTPGHPETPQRLVAIVDCLKTKEWYNELFILSPKPAAMEWISTIHTPEYIERVRNRCGENTEYLDSIDVPISAKSYRAAVAAVGGVLSAIDAVMEGQIKNAFCAVRPPGHHALRDKAMGFCIFNNVAIGARYIQRKHGLSKILIVDWDVHHGNGTQAAFYDDPAVLYFSAHQYPFYPGTGSEAEKGSGKGLNYNINVPLPAGSGDSDYLRVFEEKLRPAALKFSPDFVLISAGFDAHENDLLGGMRVTSEGFAQLTWIVKQIAEKCCEGRLVSVLEGGYGLDGLAASVEAHIRVLMKVPAKRGPK